jgi:hypothetical protein
MRRWSLFRIWSLLGHCEPSPTLIHNTRNNVAKKTPAAARWFTAVVVGLGSNFSGQLGLGRRRLEVGKPEILSSLLIASSSSSSSKYQIKQIAAGSEHSLVAIQGKLYDGVSRWRRRGGEGETIDSEISRYSRVLWGGEGREMVEGWLFSFFLSFSISLVFPLIDTNGFLLETTFETSYDRVFATGLNQSGQLGRCISGLFERFSSDSNIKGGGGGSG